jgi:hypothetical protein
MSPDTGAMLGGEPDRLHRSAGGLLSAEDEAAIGREAAALVDREHIEVCAGQWRRARLHASGRYDSSSHGCRRPNPPPLLETF